MIVQGLGQAETRQVQEAVAKVREKSAISTIVMSMGGLYPCNRAPDRITPQYSQPISADNSVAAVQDGAAMNG